MNDASSRSHLIFSILIETTNNHSGKVTLGKLSLVDLAGSERLKKTKIDATGVEVCMSVFIRGCMCMHVHAYVCVRVCARACVFVCARAHGHAYLLGSVRMFQLIAKTPPFFPPKTTACMFRSI